MGSGADVGHPPMGSGARAGHPLGGRAPAGGIPGGSAPALGQGFGRRYLRARRPPTVQMVSAMTIRADPGGAACAFYAGALAELLREYTGHDHTVAHARCQALGADACEWTVVGA